MSDLRDPVSFIPRNAVTEIEVDGILCRRFGPDGFRVVARQMIEIFPDHNCGDEPDDCVWE
jgi:hypothetical protein